AGVVDEHVDRTDLGLDLLHALGAGIVVADVPLEHRDAGRGLELVRRLVVAGVVRRDRVARLLQPLRDRLADAAGASGDQCDACHFGFLRYRLAVIPGLPKAEPGTHGRARRYLPRRASTWVPGARCARPGMT